MASGDDSRLVVALEAPPPALREPAAAIIAAERSGGDRSEAAGSTVLRWVEANCNAGEGRRMAVPLGSTPGSLRLCLASSGLPERAEEDGGLVLYGGGGDPYSGPMLGVVWGDQDLRGDGDATPVRVRGRAGVAAPITVFQQTLALLFGAAKYQLHYQLASHGDEPAVGSDGRLPPPGGVVRVTGFVASPEVYEAFRFLTLG